MYKHLLTGFFCWFVRFFFTLSLSLCFFLSLSTAPYPYQMSIPFSCSTSIIHFPHIRFALLCSTRSVHRTATTFCTLRKHFGSFCHWHRHLHEYHGKPLLPFHTHTPVQPMCTIHISHSSSKHFISIVHIELSVPDYALAQTRAIRMAVMGELRSQCFAVRL